MVEMKKRLILCLLVWFWPNVVPVFTVEQCSLWQSADVRSISFRNSLRWSIYIIIIIIINSVNKTKSSRSHLRNTTVSSETYPLYSVAALYQNLIWLDRFPKICALMTNYRRTRPSFFWTEKSTGKSNMIQ